MFRRGILLNEDVLGEKTILQDDLLWSERGANCEDSFIEIAEVEEDLIVLNSDYVEIINQQSFLVDWYDIDYCRVEAEKDRDEELYQNALQAFRKSTLIISQEGGTEKRVATGAGAKISRSGTEISRQKVSSLEVTLDPDNEKVALPPHVIPRAGMVQHNDSGERLEIHSNSLSGSVPSFDSQDQTKYPVYVVLSHQNKPHKYSVRDFANFFVSRHKFMEGILRNRQELQNTISVSRVLAKKERGAVAVIGLVDEIHETRSGNLIITVEDPTGTIKVLISKSKKELFLKSKDIVYDEVIGVSGASGDKIIFADKIVWPDLPSSQELKKGNNEEYAIFLSDIHIGSNFFLNEEFNKFLRWINSDVGNESQRDIANKVKYIFIAGDLVDGVGVYPSQDDELKIKDIKEQYLEVARLLKLVPRDKKIVICPGNHDAVHLAEPQSIFYEKYAQPLFELPNITLVSNPALVNIGKTKIFSGFDVLLYHGYSFDYYVSNVESIRAEGGYNRADLIMKFLLKRRHLAPSFKSTPYFPSHTEDPLLIKKVPDFLVTGHIHYSSAANYKGVTMISGSCWQAKTAFQEKLGHEPEPARVPIVNLKTREIKILKFN